MKKHTMERTKIVAVYRIVALVFAVVLSINIFESRETLGQTAAPAGQTSKGAVIKGKAPVNKNVLQVKLPKAQETTLPNGLRVVLLEDHKVPTVTMQMVVLSGGLS